MVDAVRTNGLTKRFEDVVAVHELDLHVETGTVYGLLGLNGAGKTTTVRMLVGALPPTGGAARVLGADVTEANEALAHRVGVLFGENLAPEPSFSPVRYLRYVGALYGLDRSTVDERARRLFDVLDLASYAEQPIRELSGGNKRKVELARTLLHGPDVLFLDEPTRELDIPSKRRLWRLLQDLADERGVTLFLCSHDAQEIARLCDRIGILREGRKTWEGTPEGVVGDDEDLVDALSARLEGRDVSFQPG
jgi:ABC-2 type transport system ATP-binding protein